MMAKVTAFSTRFIGLLPLLVILLVTAISNPDLFKKKQQRNWLKAQQYAQSSRLKAHL